MGTVGAWSLPKVLTGCGAVWAVSYHELIDAYRLLLAAHQGSRDHASQVPGTEV